MISEIELFGVVSKKGFFKFFSKKIGSLILGSSLINILTRLSKFFLFKIEMLISSLSSIFKVNLLSLKETTVQWDNNNCRIRKNKRNNSK